MKQIRVLVAILITGALACAWGVSSSSGDGSGLFEQGGGGNAGVSAWNGRTGSVNTRNTTATYKNLSATAYYGDGSHLTGIAGGGVGDISALAGRLSNYSTNRKHLWSAFAAYSSRHAGNVGGLGNYSTLRPTNIIAKGPWADVRSFGAKLDGSDDTAAVQAAIDWSRSVDYRPVFIPAGTCIVSGLTLHWHTHLVGAGMYETVLKLKDGANGHLITADASVYSVSNMTLDGNKANQTGTSHVIYRPYVPSSAAPRFSHLYIINAHDDGIHADGPVGGATTEEVQVYNCDGVGIWAGAWDEMWSDISIGQSGKQGMYIARSSQHLNTVKAWFSGRIDPSSGNGIELASGASKIQGSNVEAQDNQLHGIVVRGRDNTLTTVNANCNAQSGTGVGVYVNGATSCYISGVSTAVADLTAYQQYALRVDGNATGNIIRLTSSGNILGLVDNTSSGDNDVSVLDLDGKKAGTIHGARTRFGIMQRKPEGEVARFNVLENVTGWQRAATVTFTPGTYKGVHLAATVRTGSYVDNPSIRNPAKFDFDVWINRSHWSDRDTEYATIAGDSTDYIRAIKVQSGDVSVDTIYELQYRQPSAYKNCIAEFQIVSSTVTVDWATSGVRGSTSGTVYSPTLRATVFPILSTTGRATFAHLTISDNKVNGVTPRKYINGLDYGMKALGVSFSNRTAFEMAATTAVSQGVPLYIPPASSTYYAASRFIPPAGLTMYGKRPFYNNTTLVKGTVLQGPAWGAVRISNSNVTVQDLGILAAVDGVSVGGNTSHTRVKGVIVAGPGSGHGFIVEGQGTNPVDAAFEDCEAWGAFVHGFVTKSKKTRFIRCRANGQTTNGFVIVSDDIAGSSSPSNSEDVEIIDCRAENCLNGINVYSREYSPGVGSVVAAHDIRIMGGTMKGCTNGILVGENNPPGGQSYLTQSNIAITGVAFEYNTMRGISLVRADNVHISGNTFSNNSTALYRNITTTTNIKIGMNVMDNRPGNCPETKADALAFRGMSTTGYAHRTALNNPHQTSDTNLLTSDVTANNASTSRHGFCPKLPNGPGKYAITKFGNWSGVTGGGGPEVDPTFSAYSGILARGTGTGTKSYYYDWYKGSDNNPGTQASPMKTPQVLVDRYLTGRALTCNVNVYSNNTGFRPNFMVYMNGGSALCSLNFYGDTSAAADRTGYVGAGSTVSSIIDSSAADYTPYLGCDCFMKITSGTNNGLYRRITGWNNGTRTYTVEPFPNTPGTNDSYIVYVRYPNRGKYKILGTLSPPSGTSGKVILANIPFVNLYGFDISNSTGSGVLYYNAGGAVSGCTVHGCAGDGIALQKHSYGVAISYANLYSNASAGISATSNSRGNTLTQVTSRDNAQYGLNIGTSSDINSGVGSIANNQVNASRKSDASFTGNTYISNVQYPVYIQGGSTVSFSSGAVVDANNIAGAQGIALIGESYIDAAAANSVTIKNCPLYGIRADSTSGGYTQGAAFSNNGTNLQNDTGNRLQ